MSTPAHEKERVFVFGASGHAKVVIDAIERQGLYDIGLLVDDDSARKDQGVHGYRLTGGRDELIDARKPLRMRRGIVAIGDNSARERVVRWLTENGFTFITVVHPAAVIGRGATIGPGTVIMAGAVVNSDTVIGEHAVINTAASVDHDCRIGDFVHIAPGAHICGTVTIGRRSFVCAGVTVIPNRSIGENAIIGAASVVIDDVPDNVTAIGTPARQRLQRKDHA